MDESIMFVYTVVDSIGHVTFITDPDFSSQPGLDQAIAHAERSRGKVIENTYRFLNSETMDEYNYLPDEG